MIDVTLPGIPNTALPSQVVDRALIAAGYSTTKRYRLALSLPGRLGSRRWLDPKVPVADQANSRPANLELAVRFFDPEPAAISDVLLLHLHYSQLREHLASGWFAADDDETGIKLCASAVQAELGDWALGPHWESPTSYLTGICWIAGQTRATEEGIVSQHKMMVGTGPVEAQRDFLDIAAQQQLYGVEFHVAVGPRKEMRSIGVGPKGVFECPPVPTPPVMYQWSQILHISYRKKKVILARKDYLGRSLTVLCESKSRSKALWWVMIEFHAFYKHSVQRSPSCSIPTHIASYLLV